MGVLNSTEYAVEQVTKKYQCIDRFVPYICSKRDFSEDQRFKADVALEAEINMIKKKEIYCPFLPEKDRQFDEYDYVTQMGFTMCTRITNLYKCLFLFGNYCNSHGIAGKFAYIRDVLQDEFKKMYGSRYNPLLESTSVYRTKCHQNMTFTEYAIYNDLPIYFNENKVHTFLTSPYKKQQIFQYMCIVYMEVECGFLRCDMDCELTAKRNDLDFLAYYKYANAAKREMEGIYDAIEKLLVELDGSSIQDIISRHCLCVLNRN